MKELVFYTKVDLEKLYKEQEDMNEWDGLIQSLEEYLKTRDENEKKNDLKEGE